MISLSNHGKTLATLAKQQTWPQWRKDNGQFIPHPATWLNGKRWDDEGPTEHREHNVAEDLRPEQRQRLRELTAGIGKTA